MTTETRRWRVATTHPPPRGPYTELAEAARALGVEYAGAVQLDLTLDGTPVSLSLELDSGSVVGLVIEVTLEGSAQAPSTPTLELRPETAVDREGKARAINREVQTGDRYFDDKVYVDGTPRDVEVLRLLRRPQTRRAVLCLLEELRAQHAKLTPQKVSARWLDRSSGTKGVFGAERVQRALEALLVIARGGGPSGPPLARNGGWLAAASVFSLLGALPYLLLVLSEGRVDWRLPVLAMLATPVGVVATRPVLARVVAGDSGSYSRFQIVFWSLFFAAAMLGPAVSVHLNAALDKHPPVQVTGVAVSVGPEDEDSGTCSTTVRWAGPRGGESEYSMHPPIAVGDLVSVRRHRGALGFEWEEPPVRRGRGPSVW